MNVQIGGNDYQIRKLTPFQQFHVARRLAPALWVMGTSVEAAAKLTGDSLVVFGPVAEVLAGMSNEDSEYILSTCLAAVLRKQGSGYAQITAGGPSMMFDDIDLATMMQLTFEVVKENLGNFFDALPAS